MAGGKHQGDPDDLAEWRRLGDLLVRRRVELGFPSRAEWLRHHGIETTSGTARTLPDVERGKRNNYESATIILVEHLYDLAPGAIRDVLAGSPRLRGREDPATESDTSDPEVMHETAASRVDQDTSATAQAIREDPDLTDRARRHLLDQYDMLRELSQAAHKKDSDQPETATGKRPLRAVARKRPPRSTP